MFDQLETVDIWKCAFSMIAGLLLGLERELKDKAAGVKTISIICLGATLFSIISLRFDPDRATALSAYIVSGVGFLGAGVIFKDGVNISGLTTASIIWMAAAVGTSIGFGEFYLSAIFLLASFLIITITPWLNRMLASKKQSRIIAIRFRKKDFDESQKILAYISKLCMKSVEQKVVLEENEIVTRRLEVVIDLKHVDKLTSYLLSEPVVMGFDV